MFVKAEKILSYNAPLMQFAVYSCILGISWLGAKMIVTDQLTTGELMSLLTYCMNILMSLMMVSMVFVMVSMSVASARTNHRGSGMKNRNLTNPERPVTEVKDGSIVFDHVNFSYKKGNGELCLKGYQSEYSFRRDDRYHRWNRKCEVQSGQSDQPSVRCDRPEVSKSAVWMCGLMIWRLCEIR